MQSAELKQKINLLSHKEIKEIMTTVQQQIQEGYGRLDDYEVFLLCQQEIVRRIWHTDLHFAMPPN